MRTIKYPVDLDTQRNDYIKFTHFKYSINDDLKKGAIPPRGDDSKDIILYMPNTTPATEYGQSATYQTFAGPMGRLIKKAAGGLGNIGSDGKDLGGLAEDMGELTGGLVKSVQNDGTGIAQQAALDALGGFVGFDAATAIAIGQQKAYNPNAEMIYNQPLHRKFALTFNFVPKSRGDANMVDEIIYEFKRWSAPKIASEANFMEIPHLWQMSYHEAGGGKYRRMNLFKPCMITNVGVQDNSNSNFHITIKDDEGHVPVQTAIALTLQETMPPTRDDHEFANQSGHRRGF